MPSFIPDGYVFRAGIRPIEDVHDGIEFEYRNMTPAETAEFIHETQGASGKELRSVQGEWLVKKLVRWYGIEDDAGNREVLPKIHKDLFVGGAGGKVINTTLMSQIVDVVIWGSPADYTTDETPEEAQKNS